MQHRFRLVFVVFEIAGTPQADGSLLERLGEAGCTDALVGLGRPGRLALDFAREGRSARAAALSALADAQQVLPASARLVDLQLGLGHPGLPSASCGGLNRRCVDG
jgi:hypothetical protein